jgi:thiamine-phosphate pyrophosphorylase
LDITLMLARIREPDAAARRRLTPRCTMPARPCETDPMPPIDLGAERRERLAAARLYLVCDSKPGGHELVDVIRGAVAGGVDVVQLRDKLLGDDELVGVADAAHALCERIGALLIVNDRPFVASEAGADGVHVGQDDPAVADVRALVGDDLLIGLSTHAEGEIDAAVARDGDGAPFVDYIGVGPVHETPTKPGRPAVGAALVHYAAAHAAVPFFAIGGLNEGNVDEVLDAGARRIVVLRAIADADDPKRAARRLRTKIDARANGGGDGGA